MDCQHKICVVTRAFNRLEYTTRCVSAAKLNCDWDGEWEHVVIDNASTDGTAEWLSWVKNCQSGWWSHVRPYFSESNLGDWGGMQLFAKRIDAHPEYSCDYVLKLDNDIELPPGWATAMVNELNRRPPESAVQLRRRGVHGVKTPDADGRICYVNACWMSTLETFLKYVQAAGNDREFSRLLPGGCYKMEPSCWHMEGWESGDDCIQDHKYGYWDKRYTWEKLV